LGIAGIDGKIMANCKMLENCYKKLWQIFDNLKNLDFFGSYLFPATPILNPLVS
jgi:hypothetical protein